MATYTLDRPLLETLNSWDNEETARIMPTTQTKKEVKPEMSLSRAIYEYIKTHPNSAHSTIIKAKELKPYNKGSIGSLITQLRKKGLLDYSPDGFGYVAVGTDYVRPVKVNRRAKAQGIAALAPQASEVNQTITRTVQYTQLPDPEPFNVDKFLDTLPFTSAIALYTRLQQMLNNA